MSLYSHTTRAAGLVLTASIYNTDHQLHADSNTLALVEDISSDITAMQDTTDPYPSSVASLATTAAGELKRIRYKLAELIKKFNRTATEWYHDATEEVGDFTWVEKTGAYTAVAGDGIMVGSDTGAITITLPASASLGDTIAITDQDGNATTNNITVARNGLVIMGFSEDMTMSVDNAKVILVYSADATKGWRIR